MTPSEQSVGLGSLCQKSAHFGLGESMIVSLFRRNVIWRSANASRPGVAHKLRHLAWFLGLASAVVLSASACDLGSTSGEVGSEASAQTGESRAEVAEANSPVVCGIQDSIPDSTQLASEAVDWADLPVSVDLDGDGLEDTVDGWVTTENAPEDPDTAFGVIVMTGAGDVFTNTDPIGVTVPYATAKLVGSERPVLLVRSGLFGGLFAGVMSLDDCELRYHQLSPEPLNFYSGYTEVEDCLHETPEGAIYTFMFSEDPSEILSDVDPAEAEALRVNYRASFVMADGELVETDLVEYEWDGEGPSSDPDCMVLESANLG